MYLTMSNTGLTRRNTIFIFLWMRHRNTGISIQHVGRQTSLSMGQRANGPKGAPPLAAGEGEPDRIEGWGGVKYAYR